MWQLRLGISKIGKYASRDSGDTGEVVERPGGGLSVVIADAQGTGANARTLSNLISARAVALLKDGTRDTAVHEAAHDFLFAYKGGRVSCTLTTVSADTQSRCFRVTANSNTATYCVRPSGCIELVPASSPLGITPGLTPATGSAPLAPDTCIVACTDGVTRAGGRGGTGLKLPELLRSKECAGLDVVALADRILAAALECDRHRPVDDMTVVVAGVVPGTLELAPRRLSVELPLRDDMLVMPSGEG